MIEQSPSERIIDAVNRNILIDRLNHLETFIQVFVIDFAEEKLPEQYQETQLLANKSIYLLGEIKDKIK